MNKHLQIQTNYLLESWAIFFSVLITGGSPRRKGCTFLCLIIFYDSQSPQALAFQMILTKHLISPVSSFKEQSAHIASVKSILENHASYLMSGKELSKLVAFVKGTQFDLVVREGCVFSSRIIMFYCEVI